MDILVEFLIEFLFQGAESVTKNRKISKYIRYPILIILGLFYLALVSLFFIIGINIFNDQKIGSVIVISIGFILVITLVIFIRKLLNKEREYKNKKEN